MRRYDVFLFDADGTLYDFDKAETYALERAFAAHEFSYTNDVLASYRAINRLLWKAYEEGEISKAELQPLRFERLFDTLGIVFDPNNFNNEYLYELGRGGFLIDGALEICREIALRGKPIYIVTNGILATQASRIEHSPLKDYISDFFVSEFVGFAKPHISYFDYVFNHIHKVDKENILIIGDSLAADIAGGNNAGIDSCWLNSTGAKNETDILPTYEISALRELVKFI